jgi:hypothetical protein
MRIHLMPQAPLDLFCSIPYSNHDYSCSSSFFFLLEAHLVLHRLRVLDRETFRCEHNVKLELASRSAAGTLVLASGRVVLDGVEIDHEVILNGEDGVGCEPGIVFGVDLGDDGLVVFVCDLSYCVSRVEQLCYVGWKRVSIP